MTTLMATAPEGVGVATLPASSDPVAAPRRAPTEGPGARVLRLAHGRLTLDELVSGAWAALGAGAPATCPVCDGPMFPAEGPGGGSAACRGCGSSLS
jgi:hypothetical protein